MPVKQIIPYSSQRFKKYLRRKAFDNLKSKNIEEIENSLKSFLNTSEGQLFRSYYCQLSEKITAPDMNAVTIS